MSTAPEAAARERSFLLDAVRAAVLAPSVHNTQPWRFRLSGQTLDLFADRRRQLASLDPTGRLMFISCGAALLQARVRLQGSGWSPKIRLLPTTSDRDHLASITLPVRRPPTSEERALAAAIEARHSQRDPFLQSSVPERLEFALRQAAHAEGGWFRPLRDDQERLIFTSLLDEADYLQRTDPAYRDELQAWLRTEPASDGVPTSALPAAGVQRADLLLREFDLDSEAVARRFHAGQGNTDEHAAIALIGTDRDRPVDWLVAGLTLGRILLHLTMEGLQASILGQVIDLPQSRRLLQNRLGVRGPVQIALRIGRGPHAAPTPRRSLEDVLSVEGPV